MKDTYSHKARDILNRLKSATKVDSDAELCRVINIPTNTFSNWIKRNQFNEKPIIAFCVQNQIDLNWIFAGEAVKQLVVSEPAPIYETEKEPKNDILVQSLLKNIALLEDRLLKTEILLNDVQKELGEARDRIAALTTQKRAG